MKQNGVTKPDEAVSTQTFGRVIANPEVLPLLFYVTQLTDSLELQSRIVKDVNVLLVKNVSNFPCFLDCDGWQVN